MSPEPAEYWPDLTTADSADQGALPEVTQAILVRSPVSKSSVMVTVGRNCAVTLMFDLTVSNNGLGTETTSPVHMENTYPLAGVAVTTIVALLCTSTVGALTEPP